MAVFLNMKKEDLKKLEPLGFSHIETKTQYELARLTGPCTAILYSSGKLLLQGKNDEIRKVVDFLVIGGYSDFIENKVKETLDNDPIKVRGTIIGTDETLKGDTFGGLVVGGFLGDRKIGKKLK